MNRHQYRITVEYLGKEQEPASGAEPLVFTACSHDELLALRAKVGQREGLSNDETSAMLIGLKLLGEVTMIHRKSAPFDGLLPHIGEFIKALKSGRKEPESQKE